ncbi:DUF6318 family protein [Nocardioides speluncae]|uniref:DUF6318 family protein n=1 Tax=Nocardioides speluncae TaxID=2670337 RepID=UPI0012B175F6|nr:hypothetical protein [Nocardioides speluncae]
MVRRGTAAAICAAALVLAGCSDDPPEPKPHDPPSSSEPTTAPPTSEPPKAQTPEEAIREWLATSYEAQKSGDTTELRALARPGSCHKLADRIDQIYAAGGWVKPAKERILSIKLREKRPEGRQIYRVPTTTGPWSVKASDGAAISKRTGGEATYQFELRAFGGQWTMTSCGSVVNPGATA